MFSGAISDHEKVRLELEQHIETTKILINRASAQGRDPRELQTDGAHSFAALKTLDRHGPIEAEPAEAPADPRAAVSSINSAVLTIAGAMQEAIAATEFLTLKIEAAPLRPELVDLTERLREIDEALRVIVAAMAKTNVLASPRRRSRRAARRMDIPTPAASMHYRRSGSGSVASLSAAFDAILTTMVEWWHRAQLKVSTSAAEWLSRGKRSPSKNTRSTMSRMRRPPAR